MDTATLNLFGQQATAAPEAPVAGAPCPPPAVHSSLVARHSSLGPYSPPPPPARRGEDTQAAGAAFIAPLSATIRDGVRYFIEQASPKGLTIEELAGLLGVKVSTVCGRLAELRELGVVEDSGRRRPNASGVAAKVWVACTGRLL